MAILERFFRRPMTSSCYWADSHHAPVIATKAEAEAHARMMLRLGVPTTRLASFHAYLDDDGRYRHLPGLKVWRCGDCRGWHVLPWAEVGHTQGKGKKSIVRPEDEGAKTWRY